MAEKAEVKMVPTLGLTGVTVNAMALIAPGAFLWITFVLQAGYVFPSGLVMWAGIFVALMLAYATALSYSELAKLYPASPPSFITSPPSNRGKTHPLPTGGFPKRRRQYYASHPIPYAGRATYRLRAV